MSSIFEQLTDEQLQTLRHDPRQYVANTWRHPDDPDRRYDFYNTDKTAKVNYLLHNDGPLNPEAWGNINVLKFSRGTLKSTTMRMISNWALHMFLMYGIEIYMTAPRESQITNFTDDLQRNIRESGLDNFRIKDNQLYQKFELIREDENGSTYPVHAKFEADSGWGDGDALRGPHSHLGIIDEFQDISKAAFDTYMQCIDRNLRAVDYFPCVFVLGTPKLTNSFYHDLWKKTDQKKWDIDSRSYVQHSEPEQYLPSEDVMAEMDMDTDAIKEDPYEVRGWHVDQFNSPLHDERAIARDRANFSKMKFANEVKGEFYSPEDNLLSESHVRQCFDAEMGFVERRRHEDSLITLTADWGGGADKNAADTVFVVGEHVDYDNHDGDTATETIINNIKFLEDTSRLDVIREFEEWLIQYDVDQAIIDYGHDEGIMEDIQDGNNTLDKSGYVDTVKAARFGNVQNKTDIKWESNSGKQRFFTCDKTRSVTRLVDAVKQEEFTIPTGSLNFSDDSSNGVKLMNQLTAAYKEMKTTPSGTKKIRINKDDSRQDDAMDAFVYTWLAKEIGTQQSSTNLSMTKRKGYV
jgi:hypothetical protein